jgi:hypothetical protein
MQSVFLATFSIDNTQITDTQISSTWVNDTRLNDSSINDTIDNIPIAREWVGVEISLT